MKKVFSILLAIIMALSVFATAFAVSDETDVKSVEEIRLDNYKNGEKLTVGVGVPEYYGIYTGPAGSSRYAELNVSTGNKEIAEAVITENNKVCITANKTGKTTLTVTDINGAESVYTVKVLPKELNSLRLTFKNSGADFAAAFLGFWVIVSGIIGGTFDPIIGKIV